MKRLRKVLVNALALTWLIPLVDNDNAVEAVVARAYGLTRDQYAHVVSTFSHSSYKDAPRQCLAAFDELQRIGLEAFAKKHDPYWDITLKENLPQPVIDLPLAGNSEIRNPKSEIGTPRTGELFDFQTTAAPPGSGALFTEHPVARKRRKGTKS